MRKTINKLAKNYREQVNPSMTQEQAKKRVIQGMNKNKR